MSLGFATLFAVQKEEVGRCQVCWAMVYNEDAAKHAQWHRDQHEMHLKIAELLGVEVAG